MSSHTWNFPGEFRGRRWARGCSTGTSPWMAGEFSTLVFFFSFFLFLHFHLSHCFHRGTQRPPAEDERPCLGVNHTSETKPANALGLQTPAVSSCIHLKWNSNLKKIPIVCLTPFASLFLLVRAEETSSELMREQPKLIRYNDTAETVLCARRYVG